MDNKLIKEFCKKTNRDFDKTNKAIICFFKYIKSCMKNPLLPNIRLKNLGLFTPSISRLKLYKTNLEYRFSKKNINEENYNNKKQLINNYLEKHELKKQFKKSNKR